MENVRWLQPCYIDTPRIATIWRPEFNFCDLSGVF